MATASLAGSISEPIGAEVDVASFLVEDARQILGDLQWLVDGSVPVTLYPAAKGPFILGRLAAIDLPGGRFTFDPLGEPTIPAGELLFVATVQGVKLQFSCGWAGQAKPVARLELDLPVRLIKLQRRRFVRHEAPLGLPFQAEFGLGGRTYTLSVDDLALGGVGLRATPRDAALLYVGRRLARVRLLLGHDESLVVDLDVRSRRAWRTYLLGEQFLVGCRFIELGKADEDILRQALARLTQDHAKKHQES